MTSAAASSCGDTVLVLIVVRHGQTEPNRSGLLLGRTDIGLTDAGRTQAATLCAALHRTARVAAVISSPLRRARETAAFFEVPVEIDERWIEIDYGAYEGHPFAEVPASVWDTWRADVDYVPDGGESLAECGRRVAQACDALRARAESDDVVVVTHVSPIKAAVAWALGIGAEVVWRMHCDLASITRIAVSGRNPVLYSYNELSHLAH